ncbi:PH domain-containing protein [Nakamurella aerolata]|uniref:PH domain-containing protein n=1 Tax=Nakamurella aerolata TaxID=1656892 RepID=A0A849A9X0_9ACTN|nr:PH domain-containing protein [Nakamurella aerolata]
MDSVEFRYRPRFGLVLTVVVAVLCVVGLVLTLTTDGFNTALRTLPWLLLISGAAWAVFWRPEVKVDDGGVRLVNVLRTVDLPWPSIVRVDTKWALALVTRYGKFTAWAAPTSSRVSGREISTRDLDAMPESTFEAGKSIRPGDSPHAPSGAVAMVIRRHWEALQRAGYLDQPQLEFARPPVRWHLRTFAVGGALVLWGLLAAVFG